MSVKVASWEERGITAICGSVVGHSTNHRPGLRRFKLSRVSRNLGGLWRGYNSWFRCDDFSSRPKRNIHINLIQSHVPYSLLLVLIGLYYTKFHRPVFRFYSRPLPGTRQIWPMRDRVRNHVLITFSTLQYVGHCFGAEVDKLKLST